MARVRSARNHFYLTTNLAQRRRAAEVHQYSCINLISYYSSGLPYLFRVPFQRKDVAKDSNKTRQRLARLIGWFGLSTLFGLMIFSYRYLDDLAREESGTFLQRLIEEATGIYSQALLLVIVISFVRRFRFDRKNWLKRLPVHMIILISMSAAHTTMMALSRKAIFPIAGLGQYDYGIMSIRYVMEFSQDVIFYAFFVALVNLFDHYRESRDRELKTAQLETQLAQARLQTLQSQLQPHFLFNALNTISAVIYEDPETADTMIARLSDFLRHSLVSSETQEVALKEELDFLNLYLDIMRPRFETRLNVSFDIESNLSEALVPKLILQPLVENSIKYGADPRSGVVYIGVRASRENGAVLLQIKDEGPGLSMGRQAIPNNGVGLSNTIERLKHLYGNDQDFSVADGPNGGLLVQIKLPYRAASQSNNGAS